MNNRYRKKPEETQVRDTENIFNKIVQESFSNLNKVMNIKMLKAYRKASQHGHKRNFPKCSIKKNH